MLTTESPVAAAYRAACLGELQALKPGNVHCYADGHGMTVANFTAAAEASAPVMGRSGLAVGERIFAAVTACHAVSSRNTNLGIVLLCAPLANAAMRPEGGDLRARLELVLRDLSVADSERAYAAIRLADPGGLGDSAAEDVRNAPTVDLRAAMALAQERDLIARQYVNGFADVFAVVVPELRAALARVGDLAWAAACAYLVALAHFPDSHVARKQGVAAAEDLRARARPHAERLRANPRPQRERAALLAFDRDLKQSGLNPGTTADLTVAALFVHHLEASGTP